jgi:hypothetical protein
LLMDAEQEQILSQIIALISVVAWQMISKRNLTFLLIEIM